MRLSGNVKDSPAVAAWVDKNADLEELARELRAVTRFSWTEPDDFDFDVLPILERAVDKRSPNLTHPERLDALRALLEEATADLASKEALRSTPELKPKSIAAEAMFMLEERWWTVSLTDRYEWIRKRWKRKHKGEIVELASARSYRVNQEDPFLADFAAHMAGKSDGGGAKPRKASPRRRSVPAWPDTPKPGADQEMVLLLASPAMRNGPASPLVKLVREFEPYWRISRPLIFAVEGAYKEIWRAGLLHDYDQFVSLPSGIDGGVVHATELVVAAESHGHERTCVIYLMDPRDPASLYPETGALKRECLLAQTAYLNSYHGATRWLTLEWACLPGGQRRRGSAPPLVVPREAALEIDENLGEADDGIALAAHDRHKLKLMRFAEEHADLLSNDFDVRYATEATGHLLNGGSIDEISHQFGYFEMEGVDRAEESAEIDELQEAWRERRPADGRLGSEGWASLLTHGRRGGVIQLSRRVLDKACQTVVFFQDGQTPREYDMDMEVLDRATQMTNADCLLMHDNRSAQRWARNRTRCAELGQLPDPLTLVNAYQRRFGVELVLAHPPVGEEARSRGSRAQSETWSQVARMAAIHLLSSIVTVVKRRRAQYQPARVGFSWGGVMQDIVGGPKRPGELRRALAMRSEIDRLDGERLSSAREGAIAEGGWPQDNASPQPSASDTIRDSDLLVIPTVGLVGSNQPAAEAQAIAARAAKLLGGRALTYPELAFKFLEGGDDGEPVDIQHEWDELDVLVCNCDVVREHPGERLVGLPDEIYDAVKDADGVFGTIYLGGGNDTVEEVKPGRFRQTGISFEQVKRLAKRPDGAEVILVAGAREERQRPAWAALEANLVSTLVTDPRFAWELLEHDLRGDWPER
jgi:methylglyoxal synthase